MTPVRGQTVASQGYYDWIAAGKPFTLAAPQKALRNLLREYGYTVYDIGNKAHQVAEPPEDHMPYSATGWPDKSPRWYGFALDIMPLNRPGLPTVAQLGAQLHADKQAGIAGTEWLKYMNWEPGDGKCWHDKWQPDYVRTTSNDRGHIHLSGRSDHYLNDTLGGYDPVARWRAKNGGVTMFLAAFKIGDRGAHVQFVQYALYDLHEATRDADTKPLYAGPATSPTLPSTFTAADGQAMKRLLQGGDGVNFTPLLAKRLLRKLGALDTAPQVPTPGEGVTAAEARTIAADLINRSTLTAPAD